MQGRQTRASSDELAVVKAAAWAWFQHGSGYERPMREFDVTRTCRAPRPSRYKIEEMKRANETTERLHSPSSIQHLHNSADAISLLDPYEIKRISQQLDELMEASRSKFLREFHVKDRDHSEDASSPDGKRNGKKKVTKRKNKKLMMNGFWLRQGVICGNKHDVVDTHVLGGGLHPGKHVRSVRLANYQS